MAVELTKEIIELAFDEMGKIAAAKGMTIEIAVYGGSCLILASDIRNASGDVDAVFLSDNSTVREIAAEVAKRLGLPDDWINEGVRRMAPPPGNPEPNLMPFGEYPRATESAVGLRVLLPSPRYMLAMKILASRLADDVDKAKTDLADAVGLMKVAGISTREELVVLMKECYPDIPGLMEPNRRIAAKLDSLIDAYANSSDLPDPTWNAGTGPATR
ncbi:MAG: hypothetical protein K2Z80_37135 [Xanthobacteraceae bacterium]|nr:hypothetical protein [Xanthobacteraceae bacterium]